MILDEFGFPKITFFGFTPNVKLPNFAYVVYITPILFVKPKISGSRPSNMNWLPLSPKIPVRA